MFYDNRSCRDALWSKDINSTFCMQHKLTRAHVATIIQSKTCVLDGELINQIVKDQLRPASQRGGHSILREFGSQALTESF